MKLHLPTVSLLLVDTQCHDLARLGLADSLEQTSFAEVVIVSDADIRTATNQRWIKVPKWSSAAEMFRWFWLEFPTQLNTPHVLKIEWDGWIIDASQWTDEFLHYDYIGAPWQYLDDWNVGNGTAHRERAALVKVAVQPNNLIT